jgi:hypothetical protein
MHTQSKSNIPQYVNEYHSVANDNDDDNTPVWPTWAGEDDENDKPGWPTWAVEVCRGALFRAARCFHHDRLLVSSYQ